MTVLITNRQKKIQSMSSKVCRGLKTSALYGDESDGLSVHRTHYKHAFQFSKRYDVASDVGVNFKNAGVLSIESSLFHLFHYTFLQTKHQRKGY